MTESKLRIVAPLIGRNTKVYFGDDEQFKDEDVTPYLGIRRIEATVDATDATEVTLHVFPDLIEVEALPENVRAIIVDADESALRKQLRLAMIRMGILVGRMRACHEVTNNHSLVEIEGQAWVDDIKAFLGEGNSKEDDNG